MHRKCGTETYLININKKCIGVAQPTYNCNKKSQLLWWLCLLLCLDDARGWLRRRRSFHINPLRGDFNVQPYHEDMTEGNRKYLRRSYWLLHTIEGTVVTDSPQYIIYYIIYRKPPFTLGCLFNWSCELKTKSQFKNHVSLHRFASNLY